MSRHRAKRGLVAALALGICMNLAASARTETSNMDIFPFSDQLFHRLLADPRQVQTSLRYYRLQGRDIGDIALGNTWGMRRWRMGPSGAWDLQWNLEGMAYSRFRVAGGINEFETIDFFGGLPIELRRGIFSGRFTLFHQSSHLGDDYIRRTRDQGFRYSIEGLRTILSVEPKSLLRVYGGPTFLLHSVPTLRSGSIQWGLELKSPDLDWLPRRPSYLYLAQDFQSLSQVHWNVNSNTEIGFRLAFEQVIRSLRVHLGYFDGHSAFGQFFSHREHYLNLGMSFDF